MSQHFYAYIILFQLPSGLSSSHMSVNSELGGDSSSNLSDISDTSGTKTDGKSNFSDFQPN